MESANHKPVNRQPSSSEPTTTEQVLDLLLDALLERQAARQSQPKLVTAPSPAPLPPAEKPAIEARRPSPKPPAAKPTREPQLVEKSWTPPPSLPSINLGRTLGRLLLALVVLVVVINVPITRYGTSLARIMPDTASLVIRDGLVLKGSGEDIYVLADDKLRWISSLEAFEHRHYRWRDVHIVEESFLDKFEKGRPVHILLKCNDSPHIYRIEREQKRWIKDILTFEAEGHFWEDVKFVSCQYLRNLPDGPPIPPDAGPPPQP